MAEVTVLGVRHHGPGSARAVASALTELEPDAVLIEGPSDAGAVLALAADEAMLPPVALLVYAVEDPRRAAFYPFASFSPEWVAVRHALATGTEVGFMDLPAAHGLAEKAADGETDAEDPVGEDELERAPGSARRDPLATLATAAGYEDAERWWEDIVEHRSGALGVFAEIADAMAEMRHAAEPEPLLGRIREAAMRRSIRQAEKTGRERIAAICGAWHAPALARDAFPPAAHDEALLRGLSKVKVAATWIPWTNDRLAYASGYGAGVTSPGWYEHLFGAPDEPIARWLQKVAALLREDGLDASPASAVEAVRLAEALGAVRRRPLPGLPEVQDAALTVLCHGDSLRLGLVGRRLVVGEALGAVPEETPMVPLARDVAKLQRSLRLAPSAQALDRELDLRKPTDLQRSHLLHRLLLLGVPWGTPSRSASRTLGTFKETWRLEWHPELSVRLIEASRYGATVHAAAQGLAIERAAASDDLRELTGLVEACLLASLSEALPAVMRAIADRAARDADIGRLMEAVVPLARVQRYGNVRHDDVTAVGAVLSGLMVRICVGLPLAVRGIDDDSAEECVRRIAGVAGVVSLLERPDLADDWTRALHTISDGAEIHGLVAGRTTRLLLDGGDLDSAEARRRMELELSRPADAERGAAWLEGFLSGTGLLLLHDPGLLAVIDGWITTVTSERFDDLLPVLRRTFSRFATGERRQIGEAVRRASAAQSWPSGSGEDSDTFDEELAAAALATVLEMLG